MRSYFIKCDVSKSADVKAMVKNHSYFWAMDYASTMPVRGFCTHG
jgi:hypothetical protein